MKQVRVPWGGTALYESLILGRLHQASIVGVAEMMGLSWDEVDGVRRRRVERRQEQRKLSGEGGQRLKGSRYLWLKNPQHLEGILTAVVQRGTNARAEGINSSIQWVKYRARGYRKGQRFRDAIYFHFGGLDVYPDGVTRRPLTHTIPEATCSKSSDASSVAPLLPRRDHSHGGGVPHSS